MTRLTNDEPDTALAKAAELTRAAAAYLNDAMEAVGDGQIDRANRLLDQAERAQASAARLLAPARLKLRQARAHAEWQEVQYAAEQAAMQDAYEGVA